MTVAWLNLFMSRERCNFALQKLNMNNIEYQK